jgi:hypothetical protein
VAVCGCMWLWLWLILSVSVLAENVETVSVIIDWTPRTGMDIIYTYITTDRATVCYGWDDLA